MRWKSRKIKSNDKIYKNTKVKRYKYRYIQDLSSFLKSGFWLSFEFVECILCRTIQYLNFLLVEWRCFISFFFILFTILNLICWFVKNSCPGKYLALIYWFFYVILLQQLTNTKSQATIIQPAKELSHKTNFSNPLNCASWRCKPSIFYYLRQQNS